MKETLNIIKNDPWLEPFADAITDCHQYILNKEAELTNKGKQTLPDFASGYLYFGLHRTPKGWASREWTPNATHTYMVGTFSNWEERAAYKLRRLRNGSWEISLPADAIQHGDLYKLNVYWDGGQGEHIPAQATRVMQDGQTRIFSAQTWAPEKPYKFEKKTFKPTTNPLLIYEYHTGMTQQEEKVGTYNRFREKTPPRITQEGYSCIQVIAIREHPHYGSFGYHVFSFFTAPSRFGTPDELKALIDAAHEIGIAAIMDIVHSHVVKNEVEGLGNLADDPNQYFYPAPRREHPAWDSLCSDYGKDEAIHLLLSNCKYWLEEYKFDRFRFDDMMSMLYYSHGLGGASCNYRNCFNGYQNDDAICYLTLTNELIHQVSPRAISIAEEVSSIPGLAIKVEDGGYGFDYRMAMNIPDYWIKTIKEEVDENWKPSGVFWEVTSRRQDEKTISYAEGHDQTLVEDRTVIFRLIDADMCQHMQKGDESYVVNRRIALRKMIRLPTSSAINGGYLNSMGNEFGHPEWTDFPREGNGWSCKYARRQWDLVDNKNLTYHYMGDFDVEMLRVIESVKDFQTTPIQGIWHSDGDQVLAYGRKDLIFVFNFSPKQSFVDYNFLTSPGAYEVVLDTDNAVFGGDGLADGSAVHFTITDPLYEKEKKEWLKLYIPTRTTVVLRKKE